uniref:Uncharacterized protein n=1 Tax=Pipistrellus kuhlii TaxID=59472 RepID=A0A7J7XUT1_PIPKU|nr:hypothetical protein mPipKuh1_010417 [Pipistrellus kuhlii]
MAETLASQLSSTRKHGDTNHMMFSRYRMLLLKSLFACLLSLTKLRGTPPCHQGQRGEESNQVSSSESGKSVNVAFSRLRSSINMRIFFFFSFCRGRLCCRSFSSEKWEASRGNGDKNVSAGPRQATALLFHWAFTAGASALLSAIYQHPTADSRGLPQRRYEAAGTERRAPGASRSWVRTVLAPQCRSGTTNCPQFGLGLS